MADSSEHMGVHDYVEDPRNQSILISINGDLIPRQQATVSVFDSGFILGDGVWEGLRVYNGGIAYLDAHVDRLFEGAKTLDIDLGVTKDQLRARVFDVLVANNMRDGAHIRLMATRGIKRRPRSSE